MRDRRKAFMVAPHLEMDHRNLKENLMVTAHDDLVNKVGDALEASLPAGTTIITTKKGKRRSKGYGTITKVSSSKAKQADLPEMENHQRRIAEIEDLGDIQLDLQDQMDALKEKLKDADENLVASMKRHDRTFYHRPTWGKVILKESKTKAKVTKAVVATKVDENGDSPDDSSDE